MRPETGRILPTPEDIARVLKVAEEQMDHSLEGIWNADVARARYTDVVRYQPGITSDSCFRLFALSSLLARKAQNDGDRRGAEYFGSLAESWERVRLLFQPVRR